MMLRSFSAALLGAVIAVPAMAADMVHKMSPHTVPETIDRLETAVKDAGATVFARVDHAEGAGKVEMDLRPTQLLIFGNPELGTPAMQDKQTAGIDLPMRVLAYADEKGQVHLVYHAPETLAEMHGLPEDAEYLDKMAGALDKLTGKAIAEGE